MGPIITAILCHEEWESGCSALSDKACVYQYMGPIIVDPRHAMLGRSTLIGMHCGRSLETQMNNTDRDRVSP